MIMIMIIIIMIMIMKMIRLEPYAAHAKQSAQIVILGRGSNFRGQKVSRFSRFFWHFSRKFLPRHNLKSKFAKVFARKITEDS